MSKARPADPVDGLNLLRYERLWQPHWQLFCLQLQAFFSHPQEQVLQPQLQPFFAAALVVGLFTLDIVILLFSFLRGFSHFTSRFHRG